MTEDDPLASEPINVGRRYIFRAAETNVPHPYVVYDQHNNIGFRCKCSRGITERSECNEIENCDYATPHREKYRMHSQQFDDAKGEAGYSYVDLSGTVFVGTDNFPANH